MKIRDLVELIAVFTTARVIMNLIEDSGKIAAMADAYIIKDDVQPEPSI